VFWLHKALESAGHSVDFIPNHLVPRASPTSTEGLATYGVVMLSDCGNNNLLLHPDSFTQSIPTPNRLMANRDYVALGGALVMIGG